ncbi:CD9 antigen-like isoform X1 [Hypomesus transpacificus]|uniref:CD9 antigen-like isoform X1 n=1 Tax=Hypomesus transpacificus TaxID=137520 RepID=UPI001F074BFE|nr:CD9 antigen-like isoform X1 [Hypomesus transpacificus]
MALDLCGQLCKVILIIFNIGFALLGAAMLGLGLWLRFGANTQGLFDVNLNTQQFVIGVMVLIVLGAVILVVAVFGDYGACNESSGALTVFAVFLSIVCGLVIAAGVIAFIRSDDVGEQMAMFYTTVYAKYLNTDDPSMTVTLTLMHNWFQCCGLVGALDIMVKKTCPDLSFTGFLTMPACPPAIVNLFKDKAPLVLGLFLGTAALLLLALGCSSQLRKEIKRSRTPSPSPASYMILSTSTNLPSTPYPDPHPYQDPVVFPPLTLAMTSADV